MDAPPRDAPAPHVGTPQWQSFEGRMRARRVERCLQRAAAALNDWAIVDASAALDEARELSPADPRLQELSARLETLRQPAPRVASRHAWTGALVAGCVLFTAAGWQAWTHREELSLLWLQLQPQPHISSGLASASATPDGVAPRNAAAGVPVSTSGSWAETTVQTVLVRPDFVIDARTQSAESEEDDPSSVIADDGAGTVPKPDVRNALATLRSPDPVTPSQLDAPTPAVSESRPSTVAPPVPPPSAPASYIPSVAIPAEPTRATNSSTAPTSLTDTVATAPALNTSPAPVNLDATNSSASSVRDERVAIRAALSRYEAAYNRLDVDAVRVIWPSLDQRALARAFDNLNAQRVSLQACNVDVSGSTARANCSGNASWTPKVGGGERSASRKWTFDLSESGDGAWRIVHVQAR